MMHLSLMAKLQAAVLFSVLTSTVAFAHVTMEPHAAAAGAYTKLTFRVAHGCDGSPTKRLTVRVPEGTMAVKPQVHTGWDITTKKVKLAVPFKMHGKEIKESVSEVTWSGGTLSDEYMDEFAMSVKLPENATGMLAFPVTQECAKGSLQWSEIPKTENDHGEYPAPTLKIESKAVDEHAHMGH